MMMMMMMMMMPGVPVFRPVRRGTRSSHLSVLSVVITALLILCTTTTCVHGTTVEQDLHVVHKVDNRSPEIDPFWYVGRGVRPIGRFGKRESATPLQHTLLLLSALRDSVNDGGIVSSPNMDYYPEVHRSYS